MNVFALLIAENSKPLHLQARLHLGWEEGEGGDPLLLLPWELWLQDGSGRRAEDLICIAAHLALWSEWLLPASNW